MAADDPLLASPGNVAVPTPAWELTYKGRNITQAIAPDVLSIVYTDALQGESDSLELTLTHVPAGVGRAPRWMDSWFPEKGDRLTLRFGYRDRALLEAGTFEIDEPEFTGPPDQVTLKALAALVSPTLRTVRHTAYEDQTLAEIAGAVAKRHGLTMVGTINPSVRVARVTQTAERDLQFLKRVGATYGYVFSVKGTSLVFHERTALEAAGVVRTITRTDVGRYALSVKTQGTYAACEVSYNDPRANQVRKATVRSSVISRGDTLKKFGHCDSDADADRQARAALAAANAHRIEGSLELPGDPRCCAGSAIDLAGFGRLTGKYLIHKATHRDDKGAGYMTSIEVQRAGQL